MSVFTLEYSVFRSFLSIILHFDVLKALRTRFCLIRFAVFIPTVVLLVRTIDTNKRYIDFYFIALSFTL